MEFIQASSAILQVSALIFRISFLFSILIYFIFIKEYRKLAPFTVHNDRTLSLYISCINSSCTSLNRFSAIFIYSGLSSTPRKLRPCFKETNPVVPEPKNGSNTTPFIGLPANTHGSIKSSGNEAKCASFNGFVVTVHTDLLFLFSRIARNASFPYLPLKEPRTLSSLRCF